MKVNLLILSLIIALILTCDKDDPTSPKQDEGTLLNTVTIGSNGGKLESDNFRLTVPKGAFSSSVELKLYSFTTENPFEGNSITELFKVEGLPATFSEPLGLRLKYQGSLTDSAKIGFGEELFAKSLGALTTSYRILSARDSSGFLIAELPAPQAGGGKVARFKTLQSNESAGPISLQGVVGHMTIFSSSDHFRISSAVENVSTQDVMKLAEFLEAAFERIKALGFQHDTMGTWPVDVTIKKLKDTVFGYSAYSMFTGGYLEFNSTKMSDYPEMRLTAGHEFFHHVQTLYDPSWAITKAKGATDQFWLDEAVAVWSEELFTDQSNYISQIRNGNELAPLNGAQKGADENAAAHGYGMSAMIKYLVDNYGQDILVDIYDKISEGSEIINAIESATDNATSWYENFMRQYILGKIYNVHLSIWTANRAGTFEINSESDTMKNFSGSYPDLSAKLFQVQLLYSDIDSSAKLTLKATGGTNEITVFKYKRDKIEYVDNYLEELTVSDIRKLKDEGWHLLALITNTRAVSPYSKLSDINLEIKLTTPLWQYCSFWVRCKGYFKHEYKNNPDSVNYQWSSLWPVIAGGTVGSFNNNTFTGTWDTTYTNGEFDRGSITVTLDEDKKKITNFTISQTTGYIPGHTLEGTDQNSCRGIDIPWKSDFLTPLYFEVEGSETCNNLTSVESYSEYSYSDFTYTLVDYTCNDMSGITIEFYKDGLKFQQRLGKIRAEKKEQILFAK